MKRRDFCQVAGLAAGSLMLPAALARTVFAGPSATATNTFRLQVATTNRFEASDTVIDNQGPVDRALRVSDLQANRTYFWRVADSDLNSVDLKLVRDYGYFTDRSMLPHLIEMYNGLTLPWVVATYGSAGVGVEPADELPRTAGLFQNYPNPFTATTTIPFAIPEAGPVRLKVYNLLGQEVATLFDDRLPAGDHAYTWNAGNMASGTYICVLKAGALTQTRRLTLVN